MATVLLDKLGRRLREELRPVDEPVVDHRRIGAAPCAGRSSQEDEVPRAELHRRQTLVDVRVVAEPSYDDLVVAVVGPVEFAFVHATRSKRDVELPRALTAPRWNRLDVPRSAVEDDLGERGPRRQIVAVPPALTVVDGIRRRRLRRSELRDDVGGKVPDDEQPYEHNSDWCRLIVPFT